jgi:predicted helicase
MIYFKEVGANQKQTDQPFTVIFGNPPYSIGQRSENDNAKNRKYPRIDMAIAESYVKLSGVHNQKSLYDSYFRAFRYATDKLNGDGVIAFVTNGGWLEGNSMAGFRKSIEREFSKIYVFNLRGNARTSGELRRKEADNVFGSGSRAGITITLLVKRASFEGKAEIFYKDIGDYLRREEKLGVLKSMKTFANPELNLARLVPNEYGDWVTSRDKAFQGFPSLEATKKFDTKTQSFFTTYSLGIGTNRDNWVCNFSRPAVSENVRRMVDFYNSQIGRPEPDYDARKIAWSSSLMAVFERGEKIKFEEGRIVNASYRPFVKQNLYIGEKLIHRRGQFHEFFPIVDSKNFLICVSGLGGTKEHSVFIVDRVVDLNCLDAGTQCFPLYYYEESTSKQRDMFSAPAANYVRKDGVSDFILAKAREQYGATITKEDIFYYVYGLLHSREYRSKFGDDLKKSLPRIPLVFEGKDFWAFSEAGRKLADLHLNYETVPGLETVEILGDKSKLQVKKMSFEGKNNRNSIIYNTHITIKNIPPRVYEYIVNGKSAVEWVMERYQVKTDKDSGIVNDPNAWAEECGKPDYILQLLLSVRAVSVKTMDIVEGLPKLSYFGAESADSGSEAGDDGE